MLKTIIKTIKEHRMIDPGDRIVVGVSGGPDSVGLLHGLWSLKETLGIELIVVHLNHEYRGEAACQDAQYVEQLCGQLGIAFHGFSEPVETLAKQRGLSFEEMGRERRYALFFDVMKKQHATKIAVAQNRNDQVETILMRMMRGTGIDGMCGIPYKRADGVIRPLLDVDRQAIEAYCETHSLNPRLDATNLQNVYTRNRIRLELIPYIETHFNQSFQQTFIRGIASLQDDVSYLHQQTENAFKNLVNPYGEHAWTLEISDFKKLHRALQKRLIRTLVSRFTGDCLDLTVKQVQAVLNMIHKGQTGKQRKLPNGLLFRIDYNQVIISQGPMENAQAQWQYEIGLNERVEIPEANITVIMTAIETPDNLSECAEEHCVILDAEALSDPLIIRNRRPGDRFTPLGMKGTKKLKDYFIDLKISRQERDRIPLLCHGSQILWILGYQINEHYRRTHRTKVFRKIRFEKKPGF